MDLNVNGVQNVANVQKTETVKNKVIQPKVDFSDPVDNFELSTSKKAKSSTAKKIGAGIASALYPGFGQLVNGDVKKGAKFLLGVIGVDTLGTAAATALMAVNPAVGLAVAMGTGLAHIGIGVAGVVDAVKNAE